MRMNLSWIISAAALGLASLPALAGGATEVTPLVAQVTPAEASFKLIMVERDGCIYCARWNNEIGPKYPLTPEGKLAPLEKVDIHDDWSKGLKVGQPPVFTPTFVLIEGDTEVGRIEGYPGEDFFWGLLGMALRDAGAPLPAP